MPLFKINNSINSFQKCVRRRRKEKANFAQCATMRCPAPKAGFGHSRIVGVM